MGQLQPLIAGPTCIFWFLGSSDALLAAVITAAVALTYPVQFYVAIAVLERAVLPAKAVAVTSGADAMSEVKIGPGRIVALYYCSSTSYQIH